MALLTGLLLAAAYFPILLGGETLCYRDFGVMAIPTAAYHRAAIWSGELPLWNPYSNCGVPFLAQWGTMVLYPLSLIYVFFPFPWSLNVFCVLHLWMGAMGMYFLARRWLNEDWPAALAAVAFAFNGVTQAALSWPNYTAALGLLPWVILSVERAWTAQATAGRTIFAAAILTALQLLTGVPEIAVLTWIVLAVFWIQRLVTSPGSRKVLIFRQVLVTAGAAGLCAAQLLPFFRLLAHSQRSPGFAAEKWALPAWGWSNFLLPRFHTFTTPEGTVFQYGQEFLSSTYVGGSLALLAIFALRERNGRVIALFGLTVVAAILALGSSGFLYPGLLKVFPPLAIARYPVKFIFLFCCTVPMLSAYGVQALTRMQVSTAQKRIFGSVLVISAVMGVLVWINYSHPLRYDRLREFLANSFQRWLLFALFSGVLMVLRVSRFEQHATLFRYIALTILAVDGFTHLSNQNPTTSSEIFEVDLWAHSQPFPKPQHGLGRAFITPKAEDRLLHSPIADMTRDLTGKRLALWSHLNLLDAVPKVNGSATLQLRDQAIVQKSLYSGTNSALEAWLDFLNVTLMTSSNSPVQWQSRHNPMPFITAGQKPVHEAASLLDEAIPFQNEVALNPWSPELEKLSGTAVLLSDIEVWPAEVSFKTRADNPTVAVLPVSWHPAWEAEITQTGISPVRVPIIKANIGFQAVQIPAGEARVRIYYRDISFRLGAVISLATFAVGAISCLRKGKRPSQS